MTTKILAPTDGLGNLVRFRLILGKRHDSVEVSPMINGVAFDGLIANKPVPSEVEGAFDSNALVAELNERGAKVVISQHPGRAQKLKIDAAIYTWRHLIESFCKPKEFKRIAMRACKTDRSFDGMIYLAAAVINSR